MHLQWNSLYHDLCALCTFFSVHYAMYSAPIAHWAMPQCAGLGVCSVHCVHLLCAHCSRCTSISVHCTLFSNTQYLSVLCGVWAVSPYSPLSVSWADFKTSASAQSRACTTSTSPPAADSVTFTPLITPFGHLFSLQLPLPPSICHGDVGGG